MSVLVSLCARVCFVLNTLLTWVQCLQEKKRNLSGKESKQTNGAQPLSPGSCSHMAWMSPTHSWLNMHCPHVHREYIFCITSTQNYCIIMNYIGDTGRAIVCKKRKVPDSNDRTVCMRCVVLNNGTWSWLNLSVLKCCWFSVTERGS